MAGHISVALSILLLAGALWATPTVQAQTTWYVDDDAPNDPGPGDPTISDPLEDGSPDHPFDAIQEGIAAAADGDTVLVLDGTYTGAGNKNLDFGGRAITVRSEHGPGDCIIDCEGEGRGFHFHSGETSDALIQGLTIRNGYDYPFGGPAVLCTDSSPTIVDCTIADCVSGSGGALRFSNSDATVGNCTLAVGPFCATINCDGDSQVAISNCILWHSRASSGWQVYLNDTARLAISYCNVRGGVSAVHLFADSAVDWGAGNIDMDPLLTHDGTHLRAGSPCIDAGDPDGEYTAQFDLDGEPRVGDGRVDIGADEWYDVDTDTLPNWWESVYFDSPTAGDPGADDDFDGLTNAEEYAASRDPTAAPADYYVDSGGNDDWDGLSPVWDGVHGPKATIQAGLDAAARYEGDTVTVGDGVYTGVGNKDIALRGKMLTLRSANGPEYCIIDCEQEGRGFYLRCAESQSSVIDGFEIRNGHVTGWDLAGLGAGIFCLNSSPTIVNCVVSANSATMAAGLYSWCSDTALRNCAIVNNAAEFGGGGVYFRYPGAPGLVSCTIAGNTAGGFGGGGIYCDGGQPTIDNFIIVENRADSSSFASSGGGALCSGGDARISNCLIAGNYADDDGGGVFCTQGARGTSVQITNCTIVDNAADWRGGGVACFAFIADITNCVIWGNTSPPLYGVDTACYSDIQGGLSGHGNIDAAPEFIDPDGPDNDPATIDDNDYRLSPGSPCIDAGCNWGVPRDAADLDDDGDTDEFTPLDLDGEGRFFDDPNTPDSGCGDAPTVDMGAYEAGDTGPQPCFGDLDHDGDIDVADLAELLESYGESDTCDGDLDCDGDVDLADLAELLGVYGTSCS